MAAASTQACIAAIGDLIGFPTVSRDPNRDLLGHVETWLTTNGVASEIIWNGERTKGNLWATIGPPDVPGVILSGHSDVVPVDGQPWTSDPFVLRRADGRLYGRGACDMKGFSASCSPPCRIWRRAGSRCPSTSPSPTTRSSAAPAWSACSTASPRCRCGPPSASSASRRACRWSPAIRAAACSARW